MRKLIYVICLSLSLTFFACKKDPGPGGFATIHGKLLVIDYNSNFTAVNDSFYAKGENVYITYGSDSTVADNVKTSFNGEFKFEYLRKGKYTVFAVSKDSTTTSSKTKAIIREIEITEKKQNIDIGDIVILN